jgi:hypothetical protein
MPTDTDVVNVLRSQFRAGPVGTWYSYLGGGAEMTHGFSIEVRPNGTGTATYWGNPVGDWEGRIAFTWTSIGDCAIEITYTEETTGKPISNRLSYDFFVRFNEYDMQQVCIFEIGHWGSTKMNHEDGFWISAYPLVHKSEVQCDRPGLFRSLLRLLRH